MPEVTEGLDALRRQFGQRNIGLHAVSAATGQGCPTLMQEIHRNLGGDPASEGDE